MGSAPPGRANPRYDPRCKWVGVPRAPSGFSLAESSARSLLTSAFCSSRTPYFEVLDQNRWASTCFADTLHWHLTAFATRKEELLGAEAKIQDNLAGNCVTVLPGGLENPKLGGADGGVHQFEISRVPAGWCHLANLPAGIDFQM